MKPAEDVAGPPHRGADRDLGNSQAPRAYLAPVDPRLRVVLLPGFRLDAQADEGILGGVRAWLTETPSPFGGFPICGFPADNQGSPEAVTVARPCEFRRGTVAWTGSLLASIADQRKKTVAGRMMIFFNDPATT